MFLNMQIMCQMKLNDLFRDRPQNKLRPSPGIYFNLLIQCTENKSIEYHKV